MALRFVGIGAAKCATTWTYQVLGRHPLVSFPGGKEVNFWMHPARRGLEWYEATMAQHDSAAWMGEISVTYVHMNVPRIRALRDFAPEVPLFLHVRHPVDRAWSRARMHIGAAGLDVTSMSDAALMEFVFTPRNVAAGDYSAVLARWLSVFPAEQLLITRFDDIASRPLRAVERLCRHLGLDPAPLLGPPDVLRGSQTAEKAPIPAGFREMLTRLYAEPMRRFRDEYGIDYTGPGRD